MFFYFSLLAEITMNHTNFPTQNRLATYVLQLQSKQEIVKEALKDKNVLTNLFLKSMKSFEYDIAYMICEKIKSSPPADYQSLEIARIYLKTICDGKSSSEQFYTLEKVGVLTKDIVKTFTTGELFNILKVSSEVLETEVDPMIKAAAKDFQQFCVQRLKLRGLVIVNVDPLNFKFKIDCQNFIVQIESHKFDLIPVDYRLQICKTLVLQGETIATIVVVYFEKFGLKGISLQDRLELCKMIALQGDFAAKEVACEFQKFGLEMSSLPERLELCKMIASQGEFAAKAMASNFRKFGLEMLSLQERLELCEMIAAQGGSAAIVVEKDNLREVPKVAKDVIVAKKKIAEWVREAKFTGAAIDTQEVLKVLQEKTNIAMFASKITQQPSINLQSENVMWQVVCCYVIRQVTKKVIWLAMKQAIQRLNFSCSFQANEVIKLGTNHLNAYARDAQKTQNNIEQEELKSQNLRHQFLGQVSMLLNAPSHYKANVIREVAKQKMDSICRLIRIGARSHSLEIKLAVDKIINRAVIELNDIPLTTPEEMREKSDAIIAQINNIFLVIDSPFGMKKTCGSFSLTWK